MSLSDIAVLHSDIEKIVRSLHTNGSESDGFENLRSFAEAYSNLLNLYPVPMLSEPLPELLHALEREDVVALCDTLLFKIQPLLEVLYEEFSRGEDEF